MITELRRDDRSLRGLDYYRIRHHSGRRIHDEPARSERGARYDPSPPRGREIPEKVAARRHYS